MAEKREKKKRQQRQKRDRRGEKCQNSLLRHTLSKPFLYLSYSHSLSYRTPSLVSAISSPPQTHLRQEHNSLNPQDLLLRLPPRHSPFSAFSQPPPIQRELDTRPLLAHTQPSSRDTPFLLLFTLLTHFHLLFKLLIHFHPFFCPFHPISILFYPFN